MADDTDSPLSEVGDNTPPDSEIEAALREAVIKAYRQEDFENLTLKRVRVQVAEELGLPESFLKVDERWKDRSKHIVNDEVTKQEASPKKKKAAGASPPKKQASTTKSKEKNASPTTTKRKRTEKAAEKPPAKKQRKQVLPPSSDVEEDEVEEKEVQPEPQAQKESDSSSLSEPEPDRDSGHKTNGKDIEEELGPESELSDVLDEVPKPKSKRKSRDNNTSKAKPKPKPTKASSKIKSKAKSDVKSSHPSFQDDEVKKLQGQLAKCGIKRLWGKELAQYDTPATKIAHLKGMLTDVGMGGRFSEEKARQIREERELKADLEAIQEGEERWGKGQTDQPRRLVPKALMELQGLADDEEDSD